MAGLGKAQNARAEGQSLIPVISVKWSALSVLITEKISVLMMWIERQGLAGEAG